MVIPQSYTIQKFYQYAGYPRFKKYSNTYEACCPICREGKSWGKKRRCIYIVDKDAICCHNCGWYSKPLKWIQEVAHLSFTDVLKEVKEYDNVNYKVKDKTFDKPEFKAPDLPKDVINLLDKDQIVFYKDNKTVNDALTVIQHRRLNTAVNRPDALYITLSERTHKNRIIIPFTDTKGTVVFYQSRTIYDSKNSKYPKYLSKIGGDKSLYNLDKITDNDDHIFIFEGPIDAFFMKNGTAVAGIQENSTKTFSKLQEQQLSQFMLYKKVWVLDSQWLDSASKNKTKKLLDAGETVFIWPEDMGKKYKDVNDYCVANNLNEFDKQIVLANSFTGMLGKLKLSVVR